MRELGQAQYIIPGAMGCPSWQVAPSCIDCQLFLEGITQVFIYLSTTQSYWKILGNLNFRFAFVSLYLTTPLLSGFELNTTYFHYYDSYAVAKRSNEP